MANATVQIIVEGVDRASGVFKKLGKSVVKFGLAAGAVAVGGIAALGAAIVKLTSDAAPLIGVRDAFNNLTSDMEGGSEKILDSLKSASGGFIASSELMEQFNKAAFLVGEEFAQKLPQAMEMVGKVATATGEDFNFLMQSLVTGVGRLSPQILDNLSVDVKDLTGIFDRFGSKIGVAGDELSEAQKKTAIMDETMRQLAKNTQGMAGPSGFLAKLKVSFQNLKDEIGLKLIKVLEPIGERFLAWGQSVLPILIEKFNQLREHVTRLIEIFRAGGFDRLFARFEDGSTFFDEFFEILGLGEKDAQKFGNVIAEMGQKILQVVGFVRDKVIPVFLTGLNFVLEEILPTTIKALSTIWEKVLFPALNFVWDFLKNVFLPFIIDDLWPWLQKAIPLALEVLAAFWEDTLLPAIEKVWEWMQTVLVPFLRDELFPWLEENIPLALEALGEFWEETLLPAIKKVWEFMSVTLFPFLVELGKLIGLLFVGQLGLMIDAFNLLLDVLRPIWEFIDRKFGPTLKKNFSNIDNLIRLFTTALRLLNEELANLVLPEWLRPGSPTPFELGLRGIHDAMNQLNTMSLPQFQANVGRLQPGQGAPGQTNNFTLNQFNNGNGSSTQEFEMMKTLVGAV